MANDTYGGKAVCPFYHSHYKANLKCYDEIDLFINQQFRHNEAMNSHFYNFCACHCYRNCYIYIYLKEKVEDAEGRIKSLD